MLNLDHSTPTEPGLYLWRSSLGVELIEVIAIPARFEYGLNLPAYLSVRQHLGGSVEKLRGTFSKRLELINNILMEAL